MYQYGKQPTRYPKVSNREIRRRAQAAISAGTQALHVLFSVLAQLGGEIIVTQGTLDQVMGLLSSADFEVVPADKPREYKVRLIAKEPN